MPRWARGEKSNKKKEHDASSWGDLKGSFQYERSPEASHSKKLTYSERVNNKQRSVSKYRLQDGQGLGFGRAEPEDESDNIILYKPPKDDSGPGLASELEHMTTQHVDIVEHESKRDNKNKKQKTNLKKDKKLLDTDLTNDLLQLKHKSNVSKQERTEIDVAIKKDQRREQRRIKRKDNRDNSKLCFNCRKPGHTLEECREGRDVESGHGICYKCGSTEHAASKCKVKLPPGQYPYAKCFICGEQGHLSSMCRDNPRGLYPNGGCCRMCGSVEHYKKDCPELQKKQGIAEVVATTIGSGSVDDDTFSITKLETSEDVIPKKKPKVVKF